MFSNLMQEEINCNILLQPFIPKLELYLKNYKRNTINTKVESVQILIVVSLQFCLGFHRKCHYCYSDNY